MKNKVICLSALLALALGARSDVLDTSPFTRACTFTLSGYRGASTLAGFPVLVRLSTAIPGFDYARCGVGGSGIRFADAQGNLLPHEVDTWDVAGESCVWVRVPSLSGIATKIRLFYGAAEGTTLPAVAPRDVWDSYIMVAHGGAAGFADSSPKNLAIADGGGFVATESSGLAGGGFAKSERNPAGLNVPNPVKNGTLTNTSRYTLSAWFRSTQTNTSILMSSVTGWGGSGFLCLCEGGKYISVAVSGTHQGTQGQGALQYDSWNHVAFSYDAAGSVETYFNAANVYSNASAKPITDPGVDNWSFGSYAQTAHGSNVQGDMDEMRIYDGLASADWIQAEYDSLNNPVFAQGVAVEDIAAGTVGVTVARAVRTPSGVKVDASLAAGAAPVAVSLRWGATPSLEGTPVSLGTISGAAELSGTFPGTESTTAYYYAFAFAPANGGEETTSQVYRMLDLPVGPALDLAPFKRACTFTLQGYTGASALSGFPVLVRLSTSILGFDYSLCAPNGADLRFADADGRLLAHEVDTWNPAGESCVWVKVPVLAGNTTKIRLYFNVDDVSVLPGVAPADVWQAYVAVVHGGQTGVRDSSPKALAVSNGGGLSVTGGSGLAGGGFAKPVLTRGSLGLMIPNPVKYNTLTDTSRLTLSSFFRYTGSGTAILMSSKSAWSGTGFLTLCEGGKYMSVAVQTTHQGPVTEGLGALEAGRWNHVAFSYVAEGQLRTYFDGAQIYENLAAKTLAHEDRANWCVGSYAEATNGGNFAGDMDEVRLYDGIASADWIKAEYESVVQPSFARAMSVDNLVDSLPSEVMVTSLTRTVDGVVIGGSLLRLATGASSVAVQLVWGTTPEMADGTMDVGTFTEPGEFSCTFPGTDAAVSYYFAFVMAGDVGGSTTSSSYRVLQAGQSALWRPQTAADTWLTPSWLVDGSVMAYQPGWDFAFDGAETTEVSPIVVGSPIEAGTVTVDGARDYTFAGDGGIKAVSVEKKGTGTLTVDGRGFVGPVEWDVRGGTLRVGDGVAGGSGFPVLGESGTVRVHAGGALDVNVGDAQTTALFNDPIRTLTIQIEGDGPDGKGALVNTAAKKDGWSQAVRRLELTGDATVGGDARLDIRQFTGVGSSVPTDAVVTGPADATLKVVNTQRFNFKDTVVEQLGAIRIEDGGRMYIETASPMNLTHGLELGENGHLYYVAAAMSAPLYAVSGTTSYFGATSDGSTHNGPLTVEEGATLTVDGGNEFTITGAVTNNGTIVAQKGTLNFYGPTLAGSGRIEQQGVTVRLSGTIDSPDQMVTGSTTGGAWDLGQSNGFGYPKLAGIDFGAKGTVYLRAKISDTLDNRWATFLNGTADGNKVIICRADGETDVTTTLSGLTAHVGHLQLGAGSGSGHMVLADQTALDVSQLHIGANDSTPMPSDLTILTGTTLSQYSNANAFVGEWSGRSGYPQQLVVDGGTFDALTAGAPLVVGFDSPFAYFWLNGGTAKMNKLDIRDRMTYLMSTGSVPAFDARATQLGGSLHLGAGGFTSGVNYFNTHHADLSNGRLVNEGDWAMGRYGMNIAFGADPTAKGGEYEFDLNGHSVVYRAALSGYSDVALTGGGTFATTNSLKAIPLGHWTVGSGVTADLAGAAGFAGGLTIEADADVSLDIAGTGACEFAIMMTNQWVFTSWEDVKGLTGVYPMKVDRLRHLHSRFGTGPAAYSAFAYRGQFYVDASQAGTWTFAGGYDDNLLLEIDGADVLKNTTWNAVSSATAELTAGWHDFRVFVFDLAGGAGSPVAGWADVMNLGWTTGTPSDPKDASAYRPFDTTTLPMRVKPTAETVTGRTGALWELAGYDQNNWDTQKYFINRRRVVDSLQKIHAALADFPEGGQSASRFTGFIYIEDGQAGVWDVTAKYDDGILFKIDDTVIGTSGNTLCKDWTGKATVTAGWHRYEVRVSDKSGGIGGSLTDSEGNKSALNIAINGQPTVSFDERHFRLVSSVMEEQVDKPTGLGGETWVAAGGRLANAAPTGFCPIYGSFGGAGTVYGPFAFTGGTLALGAEGASLVVPQFENAFADMYANLGAIKVMFDANPNRATYVVGPAYGLSAEAARQLPVTAEIEGADAATQRKYADAFRASVKNGELVLLNRRGMGMTLVIR